MSLNLPNGIARQPDAGRLLIAARRDGEMLEISVMDDGAGIDAGIVIPQDHGIENTRERLRALYGKHASLKIAKRAEGSAMAALRTPYREKTQ